MYASSTTTKPLLFSSSQIDLISDNLISVPVGLPGEHIKVILISFLTSFA